MASLWVQDLLIWSCLSSCHWPNQKVPMRCEGFGSGLSQERFKPCHTYFSSSELIIHVPKPGWPWSVGRRGNTELHVERISVWVTCLYVKTVMTNKDDSSNTVGALDIRVDLNASLFWADKPAGQSHVIINDFLRWVYVDMHLAKYQLD